MREHVRVKIFKNTNKDELEQDMNEFMEELGISAEDIIDIDIKIVPNNSYDHMVGIIGYKYYTNANPSRLKMGS